MSIMGTKNSHKYFPESMAKAFGKGQKIQYLDATSGKIKEENSDSFNAELGWYTDENEEILNKEAEQQLQQLSNKINKLAKGKARDFSGLKIDPDLVSRFFAYQIIRGPANSSALLDELWKRGGIKTERKLTVQEFQNEAIKNEKSAHIITEALKESFSLILEPNFTNIEYVAVNVPVMVNFSDGRMYVLVTAPRVAFCLISKEIASDLQIGDRKYEIRDDGLPCVTQTNERVMAHAIAHKPHKILGRDSEYLKNLCQDTKIKIASQRNDRKNMV